MSFSCKSCPQAADGPFYTIPEECITCASPHEAAPDLLGWHIEQREGKSEESHCLFKKQPTTAQELDDALNAMKASCIDNLRYGGRDPHILHLMEARGLRHLCDHPVRWWHRLAALLRRR